VRPTSWVDAFTSSARTDDEVGFRGQYGFETDPQTGLVLAGHRYYSPFTRRWMNRDPIGYDGGMNLYEYSGDDPVNEVDTSGDDSSGGPADGLIDPNEVRFSQSGYSEAMRGSGGANTTVTELAAGLKNGSIKATDLPPIRLVKLNGALYTLDNRRLLAAYQAKKDVPYRWATEAEISQAEDAGKFTTENGGTFIERNSDIARGVDVMSRLGGTARGTVGGAFDVFNIVDIYLNNVGYLQWHHSDKGLAAYKTYRNWLKVWHPDEVQAADQYYLASHG
jgi:RHS repeat-associated protein